MSSTEDPIGSLHKHTGSGELYYYVGVVPGRQLVVIARIDGQNAYTIEVDSFVIHYVKKPSFFEEGRVYVSHLTGATFVPVSVCKNPDTGEMTAFGWRRVNELVNAQPTYIIGEDHMHNWEPKPLK